MDAIAKRNKKRISLFDKGVYLLLAAAMLAVFLMPELGILCGPVMAVIFTYLFLYRDFEFVIAVIILGNDALGTIVMGSLSFEYLLLVLLVFKLFINTTFTLRRLFFLLVALAFPLQLYFVEFIDSRMLLFLSIYILGIISIPFDTDSEAVRKFFSGVAFAVVLLALHAMLSGGVEFYEAESVGGLKKEILRKGILGVGIGDSNFSSFVLIFGFVSLWYFTKWNVFLKSIFSVPIIYSLILTRSFSGVLRVLLVLLVSALLQKNKLKAVQFLLWGGVGLIALYHAYINLPSEFHFEELDLYLERIEEKLFFLESGNYHEATTGRSTILADYWHYITKTESELGVLFGGNPLSIPSAGLRLAHNTFLSTLLQFGCVGVVGMIIYILHSFVRVYNNRDYQYRKAFLVLKIFCLVFAFSVSFYSGSSWTLWIMTVFLL